MNGAKMPAKKKVICPKCKAKLKFDPDKIKSEVIKFNCPGCTSVLSIRKPSPELDKPSSTATNQQDQKFDPNMENPGAELMGLARKFEEVMGFADDVQTAEPEEAESEIEPVAAEQEKPLNKKENDEEPVEEPEEEREKGSKTRDFKRVKFKKKVLVNNQIMVEALDISENGLFLHTGRSFDDGAIVEVGIPTLPGSFDLKIQAKVKHNHRGIGMGMQFVDLDDKQKSRLNTLISELDEAAAKDLEGRKIILLVGGTDTARNINKSKLVLDGFYVLQATTADEVFQILKEEEPDAMVLEWQETTFYCKGLLAQIKEKPQYDAIIRVVLSALTDSYVQREIIDAGAHRYMAKMDTNPAKLSLTLKQLIDERDS
jgi:CheY-like chemotaxis protein